MPLVYAGTREQAPITAAHERARKVRPQYARGDLIRVTGGRHLAEAELIQGILLEQGIPSVLLRGADLLTNESDPSSLPGIGSPLRLAVGILVAVALAALLVFVLYQLTS